MAMAKGGWVCDDGGGPAAARLSEGEQIIGSDGSVHRFESCAGGFRFRKVGQVDMAAVRQTLNNVNRAGLDVG